MGSVPIVLVVEDNSELRHVLKDALASEGYQVLAARDETEALETLRSTRVDLLISDLTDPPNAKQALDAVRAEFPHLTVVALAEATGYHPSLFFSAWEAPPGVRTISKPFRLGELLAISREVLGPAGHASR
jgi:CheY-like chemotaxis protein